MQGWQKVCHVSHCQSAGQAGLTKVYSVETHGLSDRGRKFRPYECLKQQVEARVQVNMRNSRNKIALKL